MSCAPSTSLLVKISLTLLLPLLPSVHAASSKSGLEPCIGLDIGNTNSYVAVLKGRTREVVIAKDRGEAVATAKDKKNRPTTSIPSVVSYFSSKRERKATTGTEEAADDGFSKDDGQDKRNQMPSTSTTSVEGFTATFGANARAQALENLFNTVSGFKRLIGRSYSDDGLQASPKLVGDNEHHHFTVASDTIGAPRVVLTDGDNDNEKEENKNDAGRSVGATKATSGTDDFSSSSIRVPQVYGDLMKFLVDRVGTPELKAQKEIHNKVQSVVLTVPASYGDTERQLLKDAATMAKVKVLKIINEPIAACLAYGLNRAGDRRILVVHAGGSTVEATLVQLNAGFFEVEKTVRNESIVAGGPAGQGVDQALLDFILTQAAEKNTGATTGWANIKKNQRAVNRIKKILEPIKKQLGSKSSAKLELKGLLTEEELEETGGGSKGGDLSLKISKEDFESSLISGNIYQSVLSSVKELLGVSNGLDGQKLIQESLAKKQKKKKKDFSSSFGGGTSFDELVLIGGMMNSPKLQSILRNDKGLMRLWTGNHRQRQRTDDDDDDRDGGGFLHSSSGGKLLPIDLNKGLNPEEAVAHGAALQCKVSTSLEDDEV